MEKTPLRLKDLSMSIIDFYKMYEQTVNNKTVVVDTFYKPEYAIDKDYFHSKKTNIKRFNNMAVELCLELLHNGIYLTFLDGSQTEIIKFSPPLFDKHFRTPQPN